MRNKLVAGLIAGAAVGGVAGLLCAPNPGKESRQMVTSRAGKLRHITTGYIHTMRSWRKSKDLVLAGPFDLRGA